MDWEMVLRRLPILPFVVLLALAGLVAGASVGAPTARAQQTADDPNGAYGDDGSYVDPAEGTSGYGGGYGDDSAYDDPNATLPGDMPATIPVPTTVPPAPSAPSIGALPTVAITHTIAGRVARLRTDGKAAIPRGAPKSVQRIIAAANRIIGKPYKWGGGHGRLVDSGYDCSGAVSYALIRAGLLGSPLVSGSLAHWSAGGAGNWVSVYANKGHVYMEVAGLRFDTSPYGDVTRRMGVRWRPVIGRRAGFASRHPVGL
jgi:cell wall-associated NlpC family hydrolase